MYYRNYKFFIVLILACLYYGCKKDLKEQYTDILGKWEVEQLLIDGHDTTAFLQSDSLWYSYSIFGIDKDRKYIIQESYYNVDPGYFLGGRQASWSYDKDIKKFGISYSPFSMYVGPYLAGTFEFWDILELTHDKMRLFITFDNLPCYLTYKKKS